MFRIKICGNSRVDDAMAVIDAGADCIGLNFYKGSPRRVGLEQASEIRQAVGNHLLVAGVFVNARTDRIVETAHKLALDIIQLSGHETPDDVAALAIELSGTPVMQALRAKGTGLTEVRAHLDECRRLVCLPRLVLWDAYDPKEFGGTGRVANWDSAAEYVRAAGLPPLILAGGLRAENVAEAIAAVQPLGVDTASGVESAPGVKNSEKLRSFVAAARAAFDKTGTPD
jgi:phosphoribosylanthranilate isomerase